MAGKKFEWNPEHTKAMKKLTKTLRRAESLKRPSYDRPIILTVDTSPTGIGWGAISDPIRSKGSQRKATRICTSQKRTMGSHVGDKIGSEVVIETDCLPIL